MAIDRPETPLAQFVQAASLDDPGLFAPICELWLSRAKAWHPQLNQTLKFDEGPASELIRALIAAYFAARTQ